MNLKLIQASRIRLSVHIFKKLDCYVCVYLSPLVICGGDNPAYITELICTKKYRNLTKLLSIAKKN